MAKANKEQVADSVIALRPNLLMETLTALIDVRRTVCLEGSPGLGKTSLFKQASKKLSEKYAKTRGEYGFILKHLPTMQPEDFGLPLPNADKTKIKFIVPDWFPTPQAVKDKLFPEYGILLMDDRNQAEAAHQKILANIVQERELHGEKLADGWTVVSTGNRQSDRAGANKVLTHLRNRETVLEFQPDLDEWCDWAYKNAVNGEVISFLRFRPGLLSEFDPQRDANPTPRAWAEGVSTILGKVPKASEHACVAGAVGAGAAVEFMSFLKIYRDLPDPDEIIRHPKTAEVPVSPSTMYALCGALAQKATKENFGNIVQYSYRIPPEFSVITVMDICRKDKSFGSTKEFSDWAMKFQDILVHES